MLLALIAVLAGIVLLVWSADKFIDGASATAHHLGMPSLLVGMIVVGMMHCYCSCFYLFIWDGQFGKVCAVKVMF